MSPLPFTGPAAAPAEAPAVDAATADDANQTPQADPTPATPAVGAPAVPSDVAAALATIAAFEAKQGGPAEVDRSAPLPDVHSLVYVDIHNAYSDPPADETFLGIVVAANPDTYQVSVLFLGQPSTAATLDAQFVKSI